MMTDVVDLVDREMREQWFETWVQEPKGGLRMPPESVTSILLADGKWHEVVPGSLRYGEAIRFTEKATNLRYSLVEQNVIAVRSGERVNK